MESFELEVLIAQIATFLIGAAALWFIALKPIRRILEERKRRIDGQYAAAAAARREAESVQEELRGRVDSLEEEERRRAKRAQSEAAKLKAEARAAARSEAQQILLQARLEARRERVEMKAGIRRDVARLAVAVAKKVTGKILSRADHGRLVTRVIGQLPAALSARGGVAPVGETRARPPRSGSVRRGRRSVGRRRRSKR